MRRGIFFIVNSAFGKKGNIGFRIYKLVSARSIANYDDAVFCRSNHVDINVRVISFGFLGDLLRSFNAIRLYLYSSFKSRKYDLVAFEIIFFTWYFLSGKSQLQKRLEQGDDLVFISEVSTKIIKKMKSLGFKVIVDIPIAPASYNKRMLKENISWPLKCISYMQLHEEESIFLADLVVCPSEFVKRELKPLMKNSRSRLEVVPFGADKRHKKYHKKTKATNKLKFCFLGNVGQRKGITYLLDAWKVIEEHDWQLLLCGRPEKIIASRIKNDSFLAATVKLMGFVSPDDILPTCDVFIFPSLMEGSSKAIYEAMSWGMPCIVTYESGSIIKNGFDGIVVKAMDVNELISAIQKLSGNFQMRQTMGAAAMKKIDSYSWQKYGDQISSIVDKL